MIKQTKHYLTLGLVSGLCILTYTTRSLGGTISEYESIPGVQTDTGSTAKTQFIFLNKNDARNTGINFKCTATPDNGSVTDYHWVFTDGTPSSSDTQNPGTVKFASINDTDSKLCTVGVTHQGSNSESCAVKSNPISSINVVVPRIDLNAGQEGVIGGTVPSTITDGTQERHFVSVQATSSDYVVLTANAPGVTASNFGILLEWDTSVGSDVSGNPNKWRVNRGTSGKFTVKLKRINDHTEVARINVWIVGTSNSLVYSPPDVSYTYPGGNIETYIQENEFNYEADITPSSMFDATQDVPDLRNSLESGFHADAYNKPHALDGNNLGDALYKWELTRRWRERALDPVLTGVEMGYPIAGTLCATLPNANILEATSPVANGANGYPTDTYEANDGNNANDVDPYTTSGALTDTDPPSMAAVSSGGSTNDTAEVKDEWQEFVRVDINQHWYIVGAYIPSGLDSRFVKIDEAILNMDVDGNGNKTDKLWKNNGTKATNANSGSF